MPSLFSDRYLGVKPKVIALCGFLIVANILVWVWAWVAFSGRPPLLGIAVVSYMFGLRHAFDADHIAAIDNVVRKLMQEGKEPISVGFFFSLGHSTIVVVASIAVAATATTMPSLLDGFHEIGGIIGITVSSLFLLAIGIANLFILRGIGVAFCRLRRGEEIVDEDVDALLAGRGFLARVFRGTFQVVSRSWHMYPIGFLFGLGFDTATEIGLLAISATQAARGLSFWTILVFPALFTAGMSLMDTTDSVLMTGAYGWAFVNPIRKLWYNLTITAASGAVAILIGSLEALGLIADKLGLRGGFWNIINAANENLGSFGFAVVGIFIASWIISAAIYQTKGYDRLQPDVL